MPKTTNGEESNTKISGPKDIFIILAIIIAAASGILGFLYFIFIVL